MSANEKCPHLQPQVRAEVPYGKDTPVSHTTTQHSHNQAALTKGAEPIAHICAFCESGFITTSTDDLRWAGWRRRGDYWVCPDCAGEDQ